MTTTIYWFSGTGNSLKIARDLAEKLGDAELIPIAKIWQQESITSNTEKVGFVHPLYYWGLPDIVYNFINKINLDKSNYIFTLITCGSGGSGSAMHQTRKLLKKKSKKLSVGFFVPMPDNYIPIFNIIPEEKQKKLFEAAKIKVEEIAKIINGNESKVEKEILAPVGKMFSKKFRKCVHENDRKFNVDENCNSCGVCEKVCPVNNIIMVENKPQWQHNCQRCLACIHLCSQKAIQWKEKTAHKDRYRHPDITVKDIISQKQE